MEPIYCEIKTHWGAAASQILGCTCVEKKACFGCLKTGLKTSRLCPYCRQPIVALNFCLTPVPAVDGEEAAAFVPKTMAELVAALPPSDRQMEVAINDVAALVASRSFSVSLLFGSFCSQAMDPSPGKSRPGLSKRPGLTTI
jgi:hypothetical protein